MRENSHGPNFAVLILLEFATTHKKHRSFALNLQVIKFAHQTEAVCGHLRNLLLF